MRPEEIYMRTFTGRKFYPLAPRAEDVCIEDIAHSLAQKCRFNGHTPYEYSVAQHSLYVEMVTADILHKAKDSGISHGEKLKVRLTAILHDAAEAYMCDLHTYVKQQFPDYMHYLRNVEIVIAEKFDTYIGNEHLIISQADKILLSTELKLLMNDTEDDQRLKRYPPLPWKKIGPWAPKNAEYNFLTCFHDLNGRLRGGEKAA